MTTASVMMTDPRDSDGDSIGDDGGSVVMVSGGVGDGDGGDSW